MKKQRRKNIGLLLIGVLFLTGCKVPEKNVPLDERITIQESCTQLSNKMANEVFEELQELILAPQEGIYKIENFTMKVYGEKEKKDGLIWETVKIQSDWTLTRKPEDNPFIMGMMEARDELENPEKIAYADQVIDGWLVEFEAYYLVKEEQPIEVFLAFEPGEEDYMLYFHDTYEDSDEMVPLKEYSKEHWGEDTELRKEMGRERLLEDLEYMEE